MNFPFQKDMVITSYMPELKTTRLQKLTIHKLSAKGLYLSLDSISAQGNPLSFRGKGVVTPKGGVNFNLVCHLQEEYYQGLKQVVKDGMYRDSRERPTFECRISGDMDEQHIYLNRVVSRVLKTKIRRFGRSLKSLFD